MGAALSADILNISLTVGELSLLNGQEAPKLKRLMQWRLVKAAAAGREHIALGARLPTGAYAWASQIEDLDRAIAYVATQNLDEADFAPLKVADNPRSRPSQDLEAIRTWIRSLPSPAE
jgi:hypothetical protein